MKEFTDIPSLKGLSRDEANQRRDGIMNNSYILWKSPTKELMFLTFPLSLSYLSLPSLSHMHTHTAYKKK